MKKRFASKSKSKGKDKIKVKTSSSNTARKEEKKETPQIKPVSINQLKNANNLVQSTPRKVVKDERTEKLEKIFLGAENPKKYDFNLHKHLKENLKFKDKLCKDPLTTNSLYCFDCKKSTCPKCKTFSAHNGHSLIQKHPYYNVNDALINENYTDLNDIFTLNPDFLDVNKVKQEFIKLVNDGCKVLFDKLAEMQKAKLEEIDKMFAETENCYDTLKKNVEKMKEDIKLFLAHQKDFLCIHLNENSNNMEESENSLRNTNDINSLHHGLSKDNKDRTNSTFLITYDLLKNTQNINDHIKYFINDIRLNREKYINDFTNKKNIIYDDIQKLQNGFDGCLNYQYLTNEFYKLIYDKIDSYNERIENMKRQVMEKVNKKGNLEDVDKDNKVAGTHLNLKFENILNDQLIDKEEAKSIIQRQKTFKRTSTSGSKGPLLTSPKSIKRTDTGIYGDRQPVIRDKVYHNAEEVKLDKEEIQDYFAYEALNLVDKKFRIKKSKKQEEEGLYDFDEDTDLAKPIPGKAEIQLYDKKSRNIYKKSIKFDKNIHKYVYFLTGCRYVLIKDKLYILGGVDKENNITKVAWVYNIKENELKLMPEMIHPHAYHAVEFFEFYKSIIVVGGQNCTSCELFDMKTGQWRDLPDLKIPRAHPVLYLDKITHILYAFFGILGKISEKNNNFCDALECLEFKKLALGWQRVEFNNRTDISFRTGINQILPLNPEMLLVYGGSCMREFVKKAAVYVLPKQEMVKIDNRMFNEIREASKKSKKLSKILAATD